MQNTHPEPWACMKPSRPAPVGGAHARGVGGQSLHHNPGERKREMQIQTHSPAHSDGCVHPWLDKAYLAYLAQDGTGAFKSQCLANSWIGFRLPRYREYLALCSEIQSFAGVA